MQDVEDLLGPVTEATVAGTLSWQEATAGFVARLPKHLIDVWTGFDDSDGSEWVSVRLRTADADPKVLDITTASQFSPRYERLMQFYRMARRSARNVDAVISAIKQDLAELSRAKAS